MSKSKPLTQVREFRDVAFDTLGQLKAITPKSVEEAAAKTSAIRQAMAVWLEACETLRKLKNLPPLGTYAKRRVERSHPTRHSAIRTPRGPVNDRSSTDLAVGPVTDTAAPDSTDGRLP